MRDLRRYESVNAKLVELEVVREQPVSDLFFAPCDGYARHGDIPEQDQYIAFDGLWKCAQDQHAWINFSPVYLPCEDEQSLFLELDTGATGWDACNPQMMLFYDKKAIRGIDVNHRRVRFPDGVNRVDAYLYAGMEPIKYLPVSAKFLVRDERVHRLQTKFSVICEIISYTEDEIKLRSELCETLRRACNALDFSVPYSSSFYQSIEQAEKEIAALKDDHRVPAVWAVGHTHIDFAWLWTKDQTKEKALRSFGTVLALMEEFPQYRFMSSQPALYECIRLQDPEMFARIQESEKKGIWETEGAMWVEADCNLTSGESLVRQILKGKQYFQKYFGKDSRICWLPDVFGYSAALPQILKKSGVDIFVTSKISWNENDRMPHEIFEWQGIDGTCVSAYFLTTQRKVKGKASFEFITYNGDGSAAEVEGTYFRLSDKVLSDDVLMPYGYGDGGGGTTPEMIERLDYLSLGVKGCNRVHLATTEQFFEKLMKNLTGKRIPRWVGELYLEFHRGTYTSIGKIKRANRKAEFFIWRTELESVLANTLLDKQYPAEQIEKCLLVVLTNQFHDILPGSSIGAVYDAADKDYQDIGETLSGIENEALQAIADNVCQKGVLVFNPGCWSGEATVVINGITTGVKNIPAKGYAVVQDYYTKNTIQASSCGMESRFYKLCFDKSGNIVSLLDKRFGREVVQTGGACNHIIAYENLPYEFDNWELKDYYREKPLESPKIVSARVVNDGIRRGVEFVRSFRNSKIRQTVWLYENLPRIDFETEVDWHEHHVILRTESDIAVHADAATYDIQFGTVTRPSDDNMSWNAAKFETCAHKFVDVSEYGYGVSLLNDCKYGHSVRNGKVGLTLLTCGTYPYAEADQGKHIFTYSLLPHCGDYREAGVIGQAYLLNDPLIAFAAEGRGVLPSQFSLIGADQPSIVIGAVKQAEAEEGIIIRAHESYGGRAFCAFKVGIPLESVTETNLLEQKEKEIALDANGFRVEFRPYEIKTFLLRIRRNEAVGS